MELSGQVEPIIACSWKHELGLLMGKRHVSGNESGFSHYRQVTFPRSGGPETLVWPIGNGLESILLAGTSEAVVVDHGHLPVLVPVPMNIGGDELQPGHTSIRIHVEDDTRWSITEEILRFRLRK